MGLAIWLFAIAFVFFLIAVFTDEVILLVLMGIFVVFGCLALNKHDDKINAHKREVLSDRYGLNITDINEDNVVITCISPGSKTEVKLPFIVVSGNKEVLITDNDKYVPVTVDLLKKNYPSVDCANR